MTIAKIETSKEVVTTHSSEVLCIYHSDVSGLAPCNHEEEDTRIFLRLEDTVKAGYNKVLICTVDTDVVVLGCCCFGCSISTAIKRYRTMDCIWYWDEFSFASST